jgi:hypothetical protein
MEETEQNIIEVDKSIIEGDYYSTSGGKYKENKKHLKSYVSCKSIAEKNTARVWENDGKYYIITGAIYNAPSKIVGSQVSAYEVVPLIPDMPNLTYAESSEVGYWADGWTEDIDDELMQKAIAVEEYFGLDLTNRGYGGQLIKSKNRMYVCNGVRVSIMPKKHGNQIQEGFSFAEPAQLEL